VLNSEGRWTRLDGIPCSERSQAVCTDAGGTCNIQLDGYTVQTFTCLAVGMLWFVLYRKKLGELQQLPHSAWLIQKTDR